MNKMQFFVISALAIVASFTGGFFANFVLGEKAAFAQIEYKPQRGAAEGSDGVERESDGFNEGVFCNAILASIPFINHTGLVETDP